MVVRTSLEPVPTVDQRPLGDGAPFGLVGVQQAVWRAAECGGQFPGQVVGVLNAGGHALAAGRGVDVSGVAGQEDAAGPVALDDPFAGGELGCPGQVAESDRQAAGDFVGDPLKIGRGRCVMILLLSYRSTCCDKDARR